MLCSYPVVPTRLATAETSLWRTQSLEECQSEQVRQPDLTLCGTLSVRDSEHNPLLGKLPAGRRCLGKPTVPGRRETPEQSSPERKNHGEVNERPRKSKGIPVERRAGDGDNRRDSRSTEHAQGTARPEEAGWTHGRWIRYTGWMHGGCMVTASTNGKVWSRPTRERVHESERVHEMTE